MAIFNIGDRVVAVVEKINSKIYRGMKGTVVEIETPNIIGVEWDECIGGHDCVGKGKDGHCWCVLGHTIKLDDEQSERYELDDFFGGSRNELY